MKKNLIFILGMLIALPGFARTFKYTYEGQTLMYEVLDEESKTCQTIQGGILKWDPVDIEDPEKLYTNLTYRSGNSASGDLILPSHPKDENGEEYTLTSIGDWGFAGENIYSVSIPETVKDIGWCAFWNCTRLYQVTLPDALETILVAAFRSCTRLKEILIPSNVTHVCDQAFYNCSNLTTVTLPQSLTFLGYYVWDKCDAIETINCYMTEPIAAERNLFSDPAYSSTLYVPEGSVAAYENTAPWSYFYYIKTLAESGVETVPAIEDVAIDFTLPYEVFNLNGVKVAESTVNLPAGIYILRQGNNVKKITVK